MPAAPRSSRSVTPATIRPRRSFIASSGEPVRADWPACLERGMLASKPRITLARPLLGVSRHDVRGYLAALKQPFRDDASNADLSRTRARIRHDLLPKLAAEYNPNVALALVRLGSLSSALGNAVDADLRNLRSRWLLPRHPIASCSSTAFCGRFHSFSARTAAPGVAECRLAGSEHVVTSLAAACGPGSKPRDPQGRGRCPRRSLDRAVFPGPAARSSPSSLSLAPEPPVTIPLAVPGLTAVPWAKGAIEARIDPGPDDPSAEIIDLEQVSLPLIVRTAAVGDRFEPLGMDGQSMPLADFFRGRNVRARASHLRPVGL